MIVRRRKRKRSSLNRPRGRGGRFMKINPRRARRRRRSNPALIVANPRRARRRRRSPMVQYRSNPSRRRRLKRRGSLHYRRRSNPNGRMRLRSWASIARVGIFGGLGIITARVGAYLYGQYAAKSVIGDEVDPKGWRHTLNEFLRLLSMGVITVAVEKGLSSVSLLKRPEDRAAFYYGGMGEMGRQAIGLVVKKLKPDANLDRYGLGEYSEFQLDDNGNMYGLAADGQWYFVGQRGVGELMERDEFGALVEREEFGELHDRRYDDDGRR